MARLIDVDKADVDSIRCYYSGHCYLEDVQEWIDDQPTVDAVPVVHGEWVDRYGGKYANPLYECSECKEKAMYVFENDSLGIGLWKQKLTNYCPNCGADMRGAEDG